MVFELVKGVAPRKVDLGVVSVTLPGTTVRRYPCFVVVTLPVRAAP